jgi:hypothetical protein
MLTVLGLVLPLAGCGGSGGDLTVAGIQSAVQEDIEKFMKKHDDKKVTVTGYYIGVSGLTPALGSAPDQDPAEGGLVVTFEAPDSDVEALGFGDEVKVEGVLYAIQYDHAALTSAHVVEVLASNPQVAGDGIGEDYEPEGPIDDSQQPEESPSQQTGIEIAIDLVHPDGYTYTVKGFLPDDLQFEVDIADAKPGEANLSMVETMFTLTAVNTAAGRNAPGFSNTFFEPLYAVDSQACMGLAMVSNRTTLGGYCRGVMTNSDGMQAWVRSGEIPADGETTLNLVLGFPQFAVDEAEATGIVESLSHPTGWVLRSFMTRRLWRYGIRPGRHHLGFGRYRRRAVGEA